MNTRLQNEYLTIRAKGEQALLHNECVLETMWEKPIWGVALQIDLGDAVNDAIHVMDATLNDINPGGFYFLPRERRHISFYQVVFWNGQYEAGAQEAWNRASFDFLQAFRGEDNKHKKFRIIFSELVPTEGAIIWGAFDKSDELENLRKHLFKQLPFPKEAVYENHIIHTTIARYKEQVRDPRSVLEYLSQKRQGVEMEVSKIILRKETIYPSLKTETLAEIRLI